MEMNNFKTVKISPELHSIIKKYCIDNGLIMSKWIETQLQKMIRNNEEENNR